MKISFRAASALVFPLFLGSLGSAGCAASSAADSELDSTEGASSARDRGIAVTATYAYAFDRDLGRAPTYGDEQVPYLQIRASVEDAVVAASHAGFNGLERPFALIPRAEGASTRWERIELSYVRTRHKIYYSERALDEYRSADLKLSEADLERAKTLGIAVGLETNVGVVWAQVEGANSKPVRAN